MKVKAYVLLRKHITDPDAQGVTYSQEAYDSVKKQLETWKKLDIGLVTDNFDLTLPPAGKIIDVQEDEKGILVTVETSKKFRPNGIGMSHGGVRTSRVIESVDLFELSVIDNPLPGHESLEEEE